MASLASGWAAMVDIWFSNRFSWAVTMVPRSSAVGDPALLTGAAGDAGRRGAE